MTSMRTVAKKLNVSATTVSRALNNKPGISQATREQVLKAMQEIGYDRKVGLRNSRYLGFVYPPGSFKTTLGNYHAALMGGIRSAITSQRFDFAMVDLLSDKENNENYTQYFTRKELRGVIMQARREDFPIVKEISDEGFPIVLVGSQGIDDNHSVNWVACNSREPTRQAIEYLINIGHRKISFSIGNWQSTDIDDRLAGYKDALKNAGIPFDPSLVYRLNPDVNAGMGLIHQIMSHQTPPTAAVFTNPYATFGALRACREMKIKVPEDLSILGFDDYQTRFMANPVYSSVCQDAYELGYDAGTALLQVINGKNTQPIEIIREAVFEVHETTGAPRS
ncbi:LacI family DNA-binding transcriptional regulator [Kiritimatiellaeota bacterium B1221]|nr:LacI family DNA-binding transcriptional regulator [Kiritimatiellaeota bacterium B1221]